MAFEYGSDLDESSEIDATLLGTPLPAQAQNLRPSPRRLRSRRRDRRSDTMREALQAAADRSVITSVIVFNG